MKEIYWLNKETHERYKFQKVFNKHLLTDTIARWSIIMYDVKVFILIQGLQLSWLSLHVEMLSMENPFELKYRYCHQECYE